MFRGERNVSRVRRRGQQAEKNNLGIPKVFLHPKKIQNFEKTFAVHPVQKPDMRGRDDQRLRSDLQHRRIEPTRSRSLSLRGRTFSGAGDPRHCAQEIGSRTLRTVPGASRPKAAALPEGSSFERLPRDRPDERGNGQDNPDLARRDLWSSSPTGLLLGALGVRLDKFENQNFGARLCPGKYWWFLIEPYPIYRINIKNFT